MQGPDRCYLENRAEEELERAQQAEHPAAVKAHYELASRYLDKLTAEPDPKNQEPEEKQHQRVDLPGERKG